MSLPYAAAVHFKHNNDLFPSKEYIQAAVPRLARVLEHPELTVEFAKYEGIATSSQRRLLRLGLFSLWTGGVALIGIASKMLLIALHADHSVVDVVTAVSEVLALLSLVTVLPPWFARTRRDWLSARFMTERMRQWHSQLLLDGALVEMANAAPDEFELERKARWASLMAIAPSVEGHMHAFVDRQDPGIVHRATAGDGAATDEQVSRAYRELRIEKQQAYFQFKKEQFAAKDEWSESLARWTLFSAIVLAAAQLVIVLAAPAAAIAVEVVTAVMSTLALCLLVVSSAVRVYRSALGVSAQRERYETKFVRLVALNEAFKVANSMPAKRAIMRDVELLAVEEMREFLRQMRRATFLV